jgi:hypothetical protein
MNPSRLLPAWLADARLRSEGSTITTVKFQAINTASRDEDRADESIDSSVSEDKYARLELRSTVGRMLWKEVWGTFVTGNTWWWEDQACVDECALLGTYWEYSIIEAVKDI